MKKLSLILLIVFTNCSVYNYDNQNKELKKYITIDQYNSYISALNFFDQYLIKEYPFETNPNVRINQFIKDFENNYLTQMKNDSDFKKSFYSFNSYLKEMENVGFIDIIKSTNHFSRSTDSIVIKWEDSIYNEEYKDIDLEKSKFLKKVETSYRIVDEVGYPKKVCGNSNVFIYGLSKSSNSKPEIKELIEKSILPKYPIILIYIKDNDFYFKDLNYPTLKAFIFYHTVLKLYDCEEKKLLL